MLIRICPLCDHEMKKKHYCETCHSFVWKPEMVDVHLNTESRGFGEESCAYTENGVHGQDSGVHSAFKSTHLKNTRSKSTRLKSTQSKSIQFKSTQSANVKNNKAKSTKASAFGVVFMIILIIGKIAVSVLENADINFQDIEYVLEDIFSDEVIVGGVEEVLPETIAFEQYELTHEEVVDAGAQCNGYVHIDIDGEILFNSLYVLSVDEGYDVIGDNMLFDEYNRVYSDKDGRTTHYEMHQTYWDEDDRLYVDVNYDSYDCALHEVSISTRDKSAAISHMRFLFDMMTNEGIDAGTWNDADYEDLFPADEGYYRITEKGVLSIYCYAQATEAGPFYTVYISPQS